MVKIAKERPTLFKQTSGLLEQAKQAAIRLEDTDNPHGCTIVIHETTLHLYLVAAAMAGIADQRDYQAENKGA